MDARIGSTHSGLRLASVLAVAMLGTGMALLLAYSMAEAIRSPGLTLVDAYWRGQLPWMGIIQVLVVGGATSCAVLGSATVFAIGGWPRRALAVGAVALVGSWWLFAWARAGISGGACLGCPPPVFDPWAYAYSGPEMALLMLILPALAIGLLALTIPARRTP